MFLLRKVANLSHSPFSPKSFARSVLFLITLILAFALGTCDAQAQNRLARLRVSSNSHFLETADGVPFFWLGDTAWFLPKLRESDIELYFVDAAAKNFNGVLIDLGYYFFEPLGDPPFLDSHCCYWDPDYPNEVYWQKIDRIVDRANAHGLYAALTVMWGNDYFVEFNGGNDVDKAYRLGKWLGQRYGNRDNVVWVVSGEYGKLTTGTYKVFDSMGRGIRDGGGTQPITIHPNGGSSSSKDFQNAGWLDFNLLQSGYAPDADVTGTENYQLIDKDYRLFPTKPSMEGEPAYEESILDWYINHNPNGPRVGTDLVRRKAYWGVFAGGFGHTYGNLSIESLYDPTEPVVATYTLPYSLLYWKDALNDPGRLQMRYLRSLIESQPILGRIPDQSILVSDPGTGVDHVQATRATNGSYAWVYIPTGGAVVIQMAALAGPSVNASWYSPRDGSYSFIGQYPNSGIATFDAPGNTATGNDWVLDLESASSGVDTTPPSISFMSVTNVTSSTATVNWTTNEPADGQVELIFPCPSSGCLSSIASALTSSHTFSVGNLTPSTTYTYRVRSRDAAGNLAISIADSFTTLDPTGNPAAVGSWTFAERAGITAFDSSGNGNNGTLVNGPVWTADGSRSALLFDGIDDYVDLGNPADLHLTGPMTLSAWVKTNSTVFNGRILSKGAGPGLRGWSLNVENYNAFEFYVATDTNTITALVDSKATVPLGTWVHVAGVYESGSALRIYINGVLDNSTTTGVPRNQFDSPLNARIGSRGDGSPFDGLIDDVRIYNRALSADEVRLLYSNTVTNNNGSPQSVVVVSGTPQSATVGTTFANALQARVTDAALNPVSGVTVTFAAPLSGAGANFGGNSSVTATTNAAGIATSPVLTANSTAGSYSVTASVAGIATPATFSLINTPTGTAVTMFGNLAPQTFVADSPAEVGVKFHSDVNGSITGIRFYKGSADHSTHTGSLWSAAGALLATGTFQSETTSGWQQMTFSAPVPIVANTTYVASYHTGGGYYVFGHQFKNAGFDNAPLHALKDGLDGPNGVYAYGAGTIFPTQGFQSNSYWADVVFLPSTSTGTVAALSGTPQNATVGTSFASTLQAKVTDAFALPVADVAVTFAAPTSGASATFGDSNSVVVHTNSGGIAASPAPVANHTAGSYTVTASVGGVATLATFNLNNTAGPPQSIVAFSGTPQSARVGTTFGSVLQAKVTDAFANPLAGVAVTFAASTSGASSTFGGTTSVTVNTDGGGIAASTLPAANNTVGTYTVTASVAGVATSATFNLNNTAGPPQSIVAFSGTPQSTRVGTTFGSVLQAKVTDALANPLSGVAVTFAAPSSGASATFGGTTSVTVNTDTAGNAFSPVPAANSTIGTYTVTASVAGVATPATFTLTNTPAGTPAGTTVTIFGSRTPQTFVADSPVEVGVKFRSDVNGSITGIRFYKGSSDHSTHTGSLWSATGSLLASGTFQDETVNGWQQMTFSTPVSIVANTTYVASYHTGGGYYVFGHQFQTASFDNAPLHALKDGVDGPNGVYAYGLGGIFPTQGFQSINFWADVAFLPSGTGSPQTVVAISGTPQSTVAGTAFAAALQAKVTDGSSNPVSGVAVTFTAPSTGAGARFGGSSSATATTDATGIATSPIPAANNVPGSYNVTASVTGLTPVTFNLTNTTRSPRSVAAISGTPQSTATGTSFAAALQAQVTDAASNPVSGVTVTFTAPSSGAGATFGGSSSATITTDATGIATSPIPGANNVPGSYNVTASVAGLTPATFNLTNTVGSPQSVVAISGTPQSAVAGTAFAAALQAKVTDGSSNPVSGVTVTFTAPSTGSSARFGGGNTATATTDANGIASTPIPAANNLPGSYNVIASVAGLTPATFNLTNTVGSPQSVVAISGTPQSAVAGTAFAGALQAKVTDGSSNPVSGVTVIFTAPSTGASARFGGGNTATATTDANGIASTPIPAANNLPGSYNVIASVAGLTPATFNLTNTVGSPQSVVAISGTPQSVVAGTTFAAALQAQVTDAASNPISGVTVTFTAPSSGAGATFGGSNSATATTNAAGIATSPVPSANSIAGSYAVTASVAGIPTPATFNLANSPVSFTSVTIFGTMAPPAFFADTLPVELGVKFRSDVSGTVTGVRFYRASADPTTHTGSLWSATGTLLATGTFTGGSSSGWQQLNFSTPVSITANTTYIASTHSGGPYFASQNYFQNAGVDSTPLHALQEGVDGANGVFIYGPGGIFPNQDYLASNFWVDVVFVPSGAVSSPSVAAVSGTPQSATVGTAFANILQARVTDASLNPMSGVAVTFAAPASGAGATFNGLGSMTVITNGAGMVMSPVPVANGIPGSYTVTVSAAGIAIPATFTLTNTPSGSNYTIFGTAAPAAFFVGSTPVEVGVRFQSDVAGTITGIRFYKSSADPTAHTGSLWSATGTLLASGTFTGGTSSGWQVLALTTPVPIAANTTYIASTHSGGPYFASFNYFENAGMDNAPLHALKDGVNGTNGVYVYGPGGIFPNFGYLSSNFWVDVVFVPNP